MINFQTKLPDPNSKTSKKRKARGFVSLNVSSRKHRRALARMHPSLVFDNKIHKPGEKNYCATGPHARKGWLYTAGGSLKYN